MKIKTYLQRSLLSMLAIGLVLPDASAAESAAQALGAAKAASGAIVGVVTSSSKAPVAHATVTAVRVDGGGIRATVSGSDGTFSFADLPPGTWSLTLQADGYRDLAGVTLTVLADKATRHDVVMVGGPAPGAAPSVAV
ncbi:MAG TPA: carboxypeptidase-like regulatory domain-containing protein, partial [Steroidobacteraceae bacterium]|nr:carboxypeptidase-like regulatory domain-containing protein [Steroidobacteraceae bacterium]